MSIITPSERTLQELKNGNNLPFKAELMERNATGVNLYDRGINAVTAFDIASAIQDTKIIKLHIGSNNIGTEGAKAIVEILKNSKVNHIYLPKNNISIEGAIAIANTLKDSKIIQLDRQ